MTAFFARSSKGMFASAHLAAHLLRGAVAAGFLYGAVTQQTSHPVAALFAGVAALVALHGCPMCWKVGLLEMRAARRRPTDASMPLSK